jgi:archaellum component FlaC
MAEEDILGSSLAGLTSRIDDAVASLKDLEKRLSNSTKEFDKNTGEVEGVRLNLKKMKDTLEIAKKSYEDLTKTTKNVSDPLTKLGARLQDTNQKFEEMTKKASEFGINLENSLKGAAEAAKEKAENQPSIGDLLNNAKTGTEVEAVLGTAPAVPGASPATPVAMTAQTAEAIKDAVQTTATNTGELVDKTEDAANAQKAAAAAAKEAADESKDASKAGTKATEDATKQLANAVNELAKTQTGLKGIYNNALALPAALMARSSLLGGTRGLLGMGAAGAEKVSMPVSLLMGALGGITGFIATAIPMYKTAILEIGKMFTLFSKSVGPFVTSMLDVTTKFLRRFGVVGDGLAFFVDGIRYLTNRIYSIGNTVVRLTGEVFLGIASRVGGKFLELTTFIGNSFKSLFPTFTRLFSSIGSSVSNGFGRITSMFSGGGAGILKTIMQSVEFIFGEAALGVFKTAFRFGASIAKYIPFLSVIPSVIETIVSAFKKMETEGVGGVIKSIFVGLLKGIAAFLTLGLSDFILDFEAMYDALSKPLDGIITQVSGFFEVFSDVFSWLGGTLYDLWNDTLKPIVGSLFENVLKPIFTVLKKVGEIVAKLVGFVLILLTPVLAILKFVFKMVFEVVKMIYDFVLKPLLDYLVVPIFVGIMKFVGMIFGPIVDAFTAVSDWLTYLNENTQEAFDNITSWIDEFTAVLDEAFAAVKETIFGWFDWFGDEEPDKRQEMATQAQIREEQETERKITESRTRSRLESPLFRANAEAIMLMESGAAAPTTAPFMPYSERMGMAEPKAVSAPVIINNTSSMTNNVAGGGGGNNTIPVALSPNPVHHMDPTRALIAT